MEGNAYVAQPRPTLHMVRTYLVDKAILGTNQGSLQVNLICPIWNGGVQVQGERAIKY